MKKSTPESRTVSIASQASESEHELSLFSLPKLYVNSGFKKPVLLAVLRDGLPRDMTQCINMEV